MFSLLISSEPQPAHDAPGAKSVTLRGSQTAALTRVLDRAEAEAKPCPGAVIRIVRAYLTFEVRVGCVVAARDPLRDWYLATVTEINPTNLRVRFHGWSDLYDKSYGHESSDLRHVSCVWRIWRLELGKRWSRDAKEAVLDPGANDMRAVAICELYGNGATNYVCVPPSSCLAQSPSSVKASEAAADHVSCNTTKT